jgi:pimeloyl-ACP methyl ester carboxylesterase
MAFIRSGDAAVYYEEYGSGPTLILLPGLLGTIETHWRRFTPDLAREFHVVLVDLRGHGRTNNPAGILTFDLLVRDLSTLIDTLEIPRPLGAGYSLGGAVALHYGLRTSSSLGALATHAMKWFWTPDAVATISAGLDPDALAAEGGMRLEQLRADHAPGNGEEGWRLLLDASRTLIGSLATAHIPAAALQAARFPVLVTTCAGDTLVTPAETRRLAHLLPDAEVAVLETCRHQMQSVQRQPFADLLARFFRTQNAAASAAPGDTDNHTPSPEP